MASSIKRTARAALMAGLCALSLQAATALQATHALAQDGTIKIGIVSFLSGQAAQSFGVPAVDGGKLLIEKLNAGEAPAPYDKKGMGGLTIEPVIIDEAGGATVQVQEFRNLVQRENVDVVVGYVSSGDCLAIAPVAEELKQFTILLRLRHAARSSRSATTSTSSAPPPTRRRTMSAWRATSSSPAPTSRPSPASTRTTPGARIPGPTSRPPWRRSIPTPRSTRRSSPPSAPASTAPRSRRSCSSSRTWFIPRCGAATCRP